MHAKDVDDPDRIDIPEAHIAFYFSKYFKKSVNPQARNDLANSVALYLVLWWYCYIQVFSLKTVPELLENIKEKSVDNHLTFICNYLLWKKHKGTFIIFYYINICKSVREMFLTFCVGNRPHRPQLPPLDGHSKSSHITRMTL